MSAKGPAGAKAKRRVVHRGEDQQEPPRKIVKRHQKPESDQSDAKSQEEKKPIELGLRNTPVKARPFSAIIPRNIEGDDKDSVKKLDDDVERNGRERKIWKKRPRSEAFPDKPSEPPKEKRVPPKRPPQKPKETDDPLRLPQFQASSQSGSPIAGRGPRLAISARGPPESSSSSEEEESSEYTRPLFLGQDFRRQNPIEPKGNDISIIRKKEKGKVYILKHRRRHHPLAVSEPATVEYFYTGAEPPPPTGVLHATVNGAEMNPKYDRSAGRSRDQKRPPLPPGSGCPAGQANMMLRSSVRTPGLLELNLTPQNPEEADGKLLWPFNDIDESEDEEEVDKKNMPQSCDASFFEGYKPSEQVSQETYRDSNLYVPPPISHVPSIMCLSAREYHDDQEEEKPEEMVQRALGSMTSRRSIPLPPKKMPVPEGTRAIARQLKKPLTLNEIQRSSLCITDPQMAPQWNSIRDQIYNETDQNAIAQSALPRSELVQFSLTRLMEPKTSEITCYQRDDGKNYISAIAPEVFMLFKFGKDVTEPNPDQLHIFAWHNLGISPTTIANNLADIVDNMKGGEAELEKMKCVAQYLFIWVSFWASDFAENREAGEIIVRMLNQMTRKSRVNNKVNAEIGEYAMRLRGIVSALKEKKQAPEMFTVPLPKEAVTFKSLKLRSYDISSCAIDPVVLVRHFTYIDLEALMRVQRCELIRKNWTDSESKETISPHIMQLTRRFDAAGAMVATSIMVPTAKARAKNITYWITCMEEARKQRNYQLLFEIDSGLCCVPVNRLEQSWKLVNKKKIASFNHLHHVTEPTRKGLLKYKTEIMEDRRMTVPFIGPFLRDLVYVWDGNPVEQTMPNGQKGYNINFQRAYQEAVLTIVQDWGRDLTFQIDKELLDKCRELKSKYESSEQLLGPSTELEPPRDNEADFIRKYRQQP